VRIERVAIGSLNVAPYNPRKDLQPSDAEYQELERSIARWDTVEPLVWNERSGNLVSGHQRLKFLRARGDAEVDVSVVSLDPTEEMALNIALNKTGGSWDNRKLFEALSTIDEADLLGFTGFDAAALGLLAEDLNVRLFTPTEPAPLEIAPVTQADVASAQAGLDKKFDKKRTVEELMCPHCGGKFGYQKSEVVEPTPAV